jgi:hypothetical protein
MTVEQTGLPAAGLPLTPFEEHMLADDRGSRPMIIEARYDFSGGPPPAGLASAYEATLRDEPILTARVERRGGGLRWMPSDPAVLPPLQQTAVGDAAGGPPVIDPFAGPQIRTTLTERPGGWSLAVTVHHAACDGLGLVGFMERWLLRAAGREGRRERSAAGTAAALAGRDRVAASWGAFVRMLPRLKVGLQGVRQFVSRRVISLDPPPVSEASAGATVAAISLDAQVLDGLEQAAKQAGCMVNDLLASAVIEVLAELSERMTADQALAAADGWIRLAVPMSLRTKSDYLLPAANRVSMVFLDRIPTDRRDRPRLVQTIRDEMELIRSHHLGHVFPLTLRVFRRLPGGLRRHSAQEETQSTAVFSNLGRCFHRSPLLDEQGRVRVGEATLEGWWIVPPIRPGTPLAFASHETAGVRTLACRAAMGRFSAAEVDGILASIAAVLRDVAASAAGMDSDSTRGPAPP